MQRQSIDDGGMEETMDGSWPIEVTGTYLVAVICGGHAVAMMLIGRDGGLDAAAKRGVLHVGERGFAW